ncbi:MAG: ferritin-like domain-containing protein [Actinomycetota bacterium]|nr:ferritin-like domain-containing protein [Actinomycetota bacterium]
MSGLAQAWAAGIAAEHRAVFGYDLLGPRLGDATTVALARTCQGAHEAQRDAATARLVAAGGTPPAPLADYPELYPVSTPQAAKQLAVRLEQDAATAWRFAYGVAAGTRGALSDQLRTSAQAALTGSAVRATQWRIVSAAPVPTVAFPGI